MDSENYKKISDNLKKIGKSSKKVIKNDTAKNHAYAASLPSFKLPKPVNRFPSKPMDLSFLSKKPTNLPEYKEITKEVIIKEVPSDILEKLQELKEAIKPLDTKEIAKEVIVEIKNLKGNDRLDISNIRNHEQLLKRASGNFDMNDQRWHGGGSSGGTPGGNNTDVQFNNNGSFGGSEHFTYSNDQVTFGSVGFPPASQLNITTDVGGGLNFLSYSPGDQEILFDASWNGSDYIAQSTVVAAIQELNGFLNFAVTGGQTIGLPVTGGFGVPQLQVRASDGAIVFNTAYEFPTTDGAGGYVLTTDGSGVITWQPGSGGTPTLTDTQIAFGDASNQMTSSSNFVYDAPNFNFFVGFGGNIYFDINVIGGLYQLGDISGGGNATTLVIDDQNQNYTLNKLGGNGNQIVTVDNNGILGINSSNIYRDNEVVSGSGTSFTLGFNPILGSEHIYGNGQRLTPNVDYTISGQAITIISGSYSTGSVLADYRY